MSIPRLLRPLPFGLGIGLLLSAAALADGGRAMPHTVPPAYVQECASCHTAYPPSLLPARSWQRLMAGLERHYGVDASLDAATARQLGDWLQAHAGTYKRVAEEPSEDRITRAAWFERKHRKIEPAVWGLPSVKTAANCAACHAGADRGHFHDNDLRTPSGMTRRQRQGWND